MLKLALSAHELHTPWLKEVPQGMSHLGRLFQQQGLF
jgi:hypothetical protein